MIDIEEYRDLFAEIVDRHKGADDLVDRVVADWKAEMAVLGHSSIQALALGELILDDCPLFNPN
jgi:hypothetical protein